MTDPNGLTVDELLTTTRAVRRRLDLERPVDLQLVRECLDLAVQAPTGSNMQRWHFVVVTDPDLRAGLAELYRDSYTAYRAATAELARRGDPDRQAVQQRVIASADHLAEHLHEVPVHLVPCHLGRPPADSAGLAGFYGSILPAVWSFMLAARSRGLGTSFTTLHLRHEQAAAELLGIPHEEVTQVALIPVAHLRGEGLKPAPRVPLERVVSLNRWRTPL